MKKIISLLLILLMCVGMTVSALAATDDFVPSIGYKDGPELITAYMVEGGERTEVTDCIVITTVSEAEDKVTDITQEERDALLERFNALQAGEKLPVDCEYVIIQLLDVNFKHDNCRIPPEHGDKPTWHAQEGTQVEVTFDLGVGADVVVDVLKYYEGAWENLVSVTNNGDGTVTCVYEDHFCPNAFIVKKCANVPQTGDDNGAQLILWGSVFAVCVLGLGAVLVVFSKKRRNA